MGEGERGEGERNREKTHARGSKRLTYKTAVSLRYKFLHKCPVFIFYFLMQRSFNVIWKFSLKHIELAECC